ncbi:MAG: hypothetical protein WCD79_13985, partial [Chthoniobacteraceae bacterium]
KPPPQVQKPMTENPVISISTPDAAPSEGVQTDPWSQPIALQAYPYTSSDLQKQADAWFDRTFAQPFLKRVTDDKPWKAAAQDYIKKAIFAFQAQRGFGGAAENGKKLIALGCDDPLISIFTQYFRCYTPDNADVADLAKEAFKRLDQEKYYSPAVLRIGALLANNVIQVKTSSRLPEIDQRVIELTKDTALAGDYPGDDIYLFMHHTMAWSWGWNHFVNNYDALAAALVEAKVPEWVQRTMKGYIEVKRAWDHRGGGYANTVSKEGWQAFKEQYDLARDDYTTAWKLNPKRPDAASEMIGITMAGNGNPGDTMRLWFDRAVAAQFDYIQAYDAVQWGLRPRWGGSVQKMMQFARLCAETRQYETEVPQQFFRILDNASEETDWRKVYRSPLVSSLVVPTATGLAEAASRKEKWKSQYTLLAVQAYLVGDGAAAADALNKAGGGDLPTPARQLLFMRTGDFDKMKQEIVVLQSASGKDFWSAEELYDQGKLDDAIAAFDKCEADMKALSNPLSQVPADRARALRLEKAFAGGDWVKIPLDAGMWRFQDGAWKATPDGCLEITSERGGYATAFASPIIGNHYELRCDIEVESQNKGPSFPGVLLGEHGTGYYVVCGAKQNQGVDTFEASATDRWDTNTGHDVGVAMQQTNTFLIEVADDHATYHLNGIPVAANYREGASPLDKTYSRIGLGARLVRQGTTIRIRSVEVRKDFPVATRGVNNSD